jgi:hypothetical protein
MLDHTLFTGLAGQQQQQQTVNRQPAPTQRPVQQSYEPQAYNPQPAYNPQQGTQQNYNPQSVQQNFNPQPVQQNFNPQPTATRPPAPLHTSRPQLPSSFESIESSSERLNEFSTQCGIPKLRPQSSTGLVVNGKAAMKGQVRE